MRLFPRYSVLEFLLSLILLSLCVEVFAIKLVDITPSVTATRFPKATENAGSCADALADSVPDPDPDDGDNELDARSEIHNTIQPEQLVSVKGCSTLNISPPSYSNTVANGIWDLTKLDDLSTTASNWKQKQPYAAQTTNRKDDGYAKEHVYEMQLLTQFMTDVVIPNVDLRGMTTCNWLSTYVFSKFGTKSVTLSSALAAVQPTGTDKMPVLMGIANSAKEAFIAGLKEFRTSANMQSKDASAILFLLRAAGVSTDYMQKTEIQADFKTRANAVRQLWITFIAEYEAAFPPQKHFDISTAYTKWINGLLTGYNTRAATFLANAKAALIGKITAGKVTVTLPIACPAVAIKTMDINAAQINALSYTQISWTYV